MTGDEVGGAGESSGEVATFPGRGYARHDRTPPYCTCYAALLGYTTTIAIPEHDWPSGGHVTDHSSALDDHSVTDQQSQALDQRASVIKTHGCHPACSRVSAGSKGQQ